MKKIVNIIYISIVVCLLSSCYDDYEYDYDYSVAYFYNQELTRSFVVNEVNEIKVGITMGGKRFSDSHETVDYIIDQTLLSGTDLTLLPEEYYSLSNNSQFEVHPGDFDGNITLSIDPSFYSDPRALNGEYAIPFRLTTTSMDSILENKDVLILQLKYEAQLFGNYYHNGATIAKDADGNVVSSLSSVYHQEEPVTNDVNNWTLNTFSANTLFTSGISNKLDSESMRYSFNIEFDGEDMVIITPNPESSIEVSQNGVCLYDKDKREFYLNYSYSHEEYTYTATDTLIYRNRILDGVNQWQ